MEYLYKNTSVPFFNLILYVLIFHNTPLVFKMPYLLKNVSLICYQHFFQHKDATKNI